MKRIVYALFPFLLIIASCTTTTMQSYRTSRIVELPEPKVEMVITISNDNIEVLGEIDIKRTVIFDEPDYWLKMGSNVDLEKFGILLSGSLMPTEKKWYRRRKTDEAEKALLGLIVYDLIELYPGMDYILFPKIEIERVENFSLSIRLLGKAARINL
jgi:hypothetical protein